MFVSFKICNLEILQIAELQFCDNMFEKPNIRSHTNKNQRFFESFCNGIFEGGWKTDNTVWCWGLRSVVPHFEVFYAMRSAVADAQEVAKCALHFITLPTILSVGCIYFSTWYFLLVFFLSSHRYPKCFCFFNRNSCVTYVLTICYCSSTTLTRGRWVLINIFDIPRLNFFWERIFRKHIVVLSPYLLHWNIHISSYTYLITRSFTYFSIPWEIQNVTIWVRKLPRIH